MTTSPGTSGPSERRRRTTASLILGSMVGTVALTACGTAALDQAGGSGTTGSTSSSSSGTSSTSSTGSTSSGTSVSSGSGGAQASSHGS